jgi:hypothetical protein
MKRSSKKNQNKKIGDDSMIHHNRTFCMARLNSAAELAFKLNKHSWTLCTGFEFNNVLWLNDSFTPDAIHHHQEYAVLLRSQSEAVMIESITVTAMTVDELTALIKEIDQNKRDMALESCLGRYRLQLEYGEHDCPLCA